MEMYKDDWSCTFKTAQEALDFFEEQGKNDTWVSWPMEKSRVGYANGGLLDKDNFCDSFNITEAAKIVEETIELGTGMALQCGEKGYLVGESAINGIIHRAKLDDTGARELYKKRRSEFAICMNYGLRVMKPQALILVREGKVRAVNSDREGNGYAVLPVHGLLQNVLAMLHQDFPGSVFTGGYTDHVITEAGWELPGQRAAILENYLELLVRKGIISVANAGKFVASITLRTSDVAQNAARMVAQVKGPGVTLQVGSAAEVYHTKGNDLNSHAAACAQLYAKLRCKVETVEALDDIEIKNPNVVLAKVVKKLGLTGLVHAEAAQELAIVGCSTGGTEKCTAHDIFWAINAAAHTAASAMDDSNIQRRIALEEAVARVTLIDEHGWKAMDTEEVA